jgi:hypothetical protein
MTATKRNPRKVNGFLVLNLDSVLLGYKAASLGEVSRSLEEMQCSNLQGPLQTFETPVTAHPVTQRQNQKYLNCHKQPGENAKSREVDMNFLHFVV